MLAEIALQHLLVLFLHRQGSPLLAPLLTWHGWKHQETMYSPRLPLLLLSFSFLLFQATVMASRLPSLVSIQLEVSEVYF